MLGKMGLTILLFVIVQGAVALTEARLLHHSSSGQTVVFNLGTKDAIKEGDYAVILKKNQDYETRDMRLIPVARAKIVKVNSDSSIWIIYRKLDKKFLKKSEAFLILSESHLLEGRRPPNIGRIQYVTTQESSKNKLKTISQAIKKISAS